MERHRKIPGNRSEFRTKKYGWRRTVKFRIPNMRVPRNLVGPVIRELREQGGLTQPMLVARLNLAGWDISRETLAKIESQAQVEPVRGGGLRRAGFRSERKEQTRGHGGETRDRGRKGLP